MKEPEVIRRRTRSQKSAGQLEAAQRRKKMEEALREEGRPTLHVSLFEAALMNKRG